MKNHILMAGAVVAALAIPFAADAQSGATTGAAGSVKGFVQDIKGLAVKHNEFRRVLYTAKNLQLVVMALKPKEEIGAEVHKLDQFSVSYTHLRAHETDSYLVCRLLLEKKKKNMTYQKKKQK